MTAFLIANIAPLMFVSLIVVLLLGYPVAFSLAAVGIAYALLGIHLGLLTPSLVQALPERVWGVMSNDTLLAVPFFTFMGLILERSGMAEDLLDTIGQVFGPVRGGLAYAVIFVGALLAATTGVVAASVISMGLISLPIMLRYGYDRRFASGVIAASGTLAQIIPPSLVLIIMADQLGKSVGDMYAGAFIPGITLAILYAAYAFGVCVVKPAWAPALPLEARTLREPRRCRRHAFAAGADDRRGRVGSRVRALEVRPRRSDRRDAGHRDQRRHRSRVFCRGAQPRVQAGTAVATRRTRSLCDDTAAGADLPGAGNDLPRRRDADRRRRDGRKRRADHGAGAQALELETASPGDGHHGQAVDLRRVHPGRRPRIQPDLLRRQRPRLGRAIAAASARRPAGLPDRRQHPDLLPGVLPRLLRAFLHRHSRWSARSPTSWAST